MVRKWFINFVLFSALLSTIILYNGWGFQPASLTKAFLASNDNPQVNTPRILEEEGSNSGGHKKLTPDQPEFWIFLTMVFVSTSFAGLMSGLTVGYLSIDKLELEIKLKTGTQKEKDDANALLPILAKHHLLLSTLLLGNALAMESLPIFLDALVPAVLAVIISTTLVLILGEVLPQAYCTGPKQIQIARAMAPVIRFFMFIFYPICYPISVFLDNLLGLHGKTRFVKQDLKALIELHKMDRSGPPKSHIDGHEIKVDSHLTADEIKVINSTIDLKETPVTKEMERIEKVFMISTVAVIDQDMIRRISKSGYSKIPVYKNHDKNNIIGILKVKSLLGYERFLGKTVEECQLPLMAPVIVAKDTSMLEMLMLFQEKKTSIAVVSDETVKDKGGNAMFFSRRNLTVEESKIRLIGVINLKDIFEEILESKMVDDDEHGAVTLHSGGLQMKKRFNRGGDDYSEAMERPEKGLKKPLLEL